MKSIIPNNICLAFTMLPLTLLALFSVSSINARTNYEPYGFTTFAGIGPGSADGAGAAARFNLPSGVAVDSAGNSYVADTLNHTIRKITPAGVVTTFAGSAGNLGSADGTGTAAQFNRPKAVAVDASGNVYVADSGNHTIRKITYSRVVTTVAGSAGMPGSLDGIGSAARFNTPSGLAVDSAGSLYVADTYNQTIRKVTSSGIVSTFAGLPGVAGSTSGTGAHARFNSPQGIAVDRFGRVFVADTQNYTIRKISPNGTVDWAFAGYPGKPGSVDGMLGQARFSYPTGIAVDSAFNIFVTDNNTIRKITSGVVSTLAGSADDFGSVDGTGSTARFYAPHGIAVDTAGKVYVADTGNHIIRNITPDAAVTTLAGLAGRGSVDGRSTSARFFHPSAVAVDDAGYVYVVDSGNGTIRKISSSGAVTTLGGGFSDPRGIAVDTGGNVYLANGHDNTILKISPTGIVTILAGSGYEGIVDGTGTAARFNDPFCLTIDSTGNLYVGSVLGDIRKVTAEGVVTTLVSAYSGIDFPLGIAVNDQGDIYVADSGHNRICKIDPAGVITNFAGSYSAGSADGTGSVARFNFPGSVALDDIGNLYVFDCGNQTVRKITPTAVVTTLAGLAGIPGSADGIGSAARFNSPSRQSPSQGMAVNRAGTLYVGDYLNNVIRLGYPTTRLETESLKVQSITPPPVGTPSAQWFGVFNSTAASGGAGTYFSANAVGNYITYAVPVVEPGTYHIKVGVQTKPNKGKFQLAINGIAQGIVQDEYSASAAFSVRDLGTVTFFSAGDQSFTFTVKGRNAASTGYTLAFDYIELIPTTRQETESPKVQSVTSGVPYGVSSGSTAASGGAATYFNATAVGNYITYAVPVVKAGTYHVRVGVQTRNNKGIFQLAINGLNIGQPQDEYYPSLTYGVRDLGPVSFSVAGNYAFKFTVTGKNASSSGYTLAFDYIELIRE